MRLTSIFLVLCLASWLAGCQGGFQVQAGSSASGSASGSQSGSTSTGANVPNADTGSGYAPATTSVGTPAVPSAGSASASVPAAPSAGSVSGQAGTVVTKGMGATKEQARNDALRTAVEQVVGVRIFSETTVRDFVAIKDAIVSRSFGLVTSYDVLSENKSGDIWEVQVRAVVSADAASRWDQIKVILQQQGNPTIMFCLRETLNGADTAQSTGEEAIERNFRNLGFQTIDRRSFEKTRELHKYLGSLDGDHNAVVAAAADQGADLVVLGMLEGSYKGASNMYGMEYQEHNYIFSTRIIRVDTAQIVGSMSKSFLKGYPSMQGSPDHLGRKGFAWAAEYSYIESLVVDLVNTWVNEMQNSGTPLTLSISNAQYRLRNTVKAELEARSDLFLSVDVDQYRNNILKLRVMSRIPAEELAETMDGFAVESGGRLEVDSVTRNTVELRYEE